MDFQEQLEHLLKVSEKDPYLGLSRTIFLLDKHTGQAKEYIAKRKIVQSSFLLGLARWFEKNSREYEDVKKFLNNITNRKKFIERSLINTRTRNKQILESQKIFYETVNIAVEKMTQKKSPDYTLELVKHECENNTINYTYWNWLKQKTNQAKGKTRREYRV